MNTRFQDRNMHYKIKNILLERKLELKLLSKEIMKLNDYPCYYCHIANQSNISTTEFRAKIKCNKRYNNLILFTDDNNFLFLIEP